MSNMDRERESEIASEYTHSASQPGTGRARGARVEDLSAFNYRAVLESRLQASERFRLHEARSEGLRWKPLRLSLPCAAAGLSLLALQFLLPGWLNSAVQAEALWLPWLRLGLIFCGIILLIIAGPQSAAGMNVSAEAKRGIRKPEGQ